MYTQIIDLFVLEIAQLLGCYWDTSNCKDLSSRAKLSVPVEVLKETSFVNFGSRFLLGEALKLDMADNTYD